MIRNNGNQERSGLRADSWLMNPRGSLAHFYVAGSKWSETAVCGSAKRSMADSITDHPHRCPTCVLSAR